MSQVPSLPRGLGSIPGWGTMIPQAAWPKYSEQCQVHSKYCAIVIYSYILFFYSFQRVYSPSGEPKYPMIIQKLLNTDPILMNGQVI